jgi:hypothetical protein
MKRLIIALICLAMVPVASAGKINTQVIKSDPVRGGDNYLILNDKDKATGRIKPNPLYPSGSGQYLILDKNGNETGIIKPDNINKDQYIIETVKD